MHSRVASPSHLLFDQQSADRDGVLSFPTAACAPPGALTDQPCPSCCDCANDCVDCAFCAEHGCTHCEVPDLTPRTANMLIIAGVTLEAHTRVQTPNCAQPVFLHVLASAFERFTAGLRAGRRPVPTCLAEQLCLHLMIAYACELSCAVGEAFNVGLPYSDYDYYFDRLYDTLLADDEHRIFLAAVRWDRHANPIVDFAQLASSTAGASIERLMAPFADDALT
ncbi:hypothetical protein [Mycolicibacterium sp. XJ1819]